jgi:hypothetical protein
MSENPLFSAFFEGFKPARQRERAALTIYRALEARNEVAMQDVGGGSSHAPARAPRRTRTTSRKPASDGGEDGDGDGPAPRYSIGATAHEGLTVQTADGQRARLCVVSDDGEILSDDVCGDAFRVAVAAYRNFLMGAGHLRVLSKPPEWTKQ